jgi:uncharacterized protein (DUF2252 family)
MSRQEQRETGKSLRSSVARREHGDWSPAPAREDPLVVLERENASRIADLVPIRMSRMASSPFSFFRGAAGIMAADLATHPTTGVVVQACGDAHLANFGVFASPERRLVFDLNDFDETHPGPWEWDVKRLAASLEIAARANGLARKQRREIQLAMLRSYQGAMTEFAGMHELDVWYARADVADIKETLRHQLKKARRKSVDKSIAKARTRTSRRAMGKLTQLVDGETRHIVADPPLVMPLRDLLPPDERGAFEDRMRTLLANYRSTLQTDRRTLLDKFEYVDMARKVVGVGSVGTRCWIALMYGRDANDPLFLQVKEASRSVIAEYGGIDSDDSDPECQGKRVVDGQRLMQAVSDIFLGWESADGIDGVRRHFYVRQLADWKGSAVIEEMTPGSLSDYGRLCGWTLARAHARSGDRVAIAAYLGDDTTFAHAIAEFSVAYADQNDQDYAAMQAAMRSGRIAVEPDCR